MRRAQTVKTLLLVTLSTLILAGATVTPATAAPTSTYPRVFATVTFDFEGMLQDTASSVIGRDGSFEVGTAPAVHAAAEQQWHLVQLGNSLNLFSIVNASTGRVLRGLPNATTAGAVSTSTIGTLTESPDSPSSIWAIRELDANLGGRVFAATGSLDVTLRKYPGSQVLQPRADHSLELSTAARGTWRMTREDAPPQGELTTPRLAASATLNGTSLGAQATVRGLGRASGLEFQVYGPATPVSGACDSANWGSAPVQREYVMVTGDGATALPSKELTAPGCYSYALRLWETPSTVAVATTVGTITGTVQYVPRPVSYPIDRGVVTLTSQSAAGSPVSTLQETGNVYIHHPDARNVVASPGSWGITQQRWRLIQTGSDTYRFLNVDSGRALQATNDTAFLPLHDTNDPAYASPRFTVVTTPASWNIDQQQIRVQRVPGGDGTQVILWGKVGSTEQRIEVTPTGYLNIPGVWLVGTGPGTVPWTVSGYTFPR